MAMIKRILSFALTFCLVISVITIIAVTVNAAEPEVWDGTVANAFAGGDGTAANPYEIANGAQLAYMAKYINTDASAANAAKHYELTADIVLNTGNAVDWATTAPVNASDPIGYYVSGADEAGVRANLFCGTFNGNNHKISGMYIKEDRSAAPFTHVGVGMFAMAMGATIKNFALVNSYICAKDRVGAIVGMLSTGADGTIENIYSDAIVDYGTYTGGSEGAGGIAGHGTKDGGTAYIKSCVFAGKVNALSVGGGIVGHANGKKIDISNCLMSGTIISAGSYAGGIVARNAGDGKLIISKCINVGSVTGTDANNTATIACNTSGYSTISDIYVINTDQLTCRNSQIDGSTSTTDKYTVTAANTIITPDKLEKYRTRKVRILNGAHTSFVPYAMLSGFDTVKSCMDDEKMRKYIKKCVYDEIIPTLDLPLEELTEYADDVILRFSNPYIKHYLSSIALNSVSKFKVRVLPSILEYKKRFGLYPEALTFSLAKLIEFYKTDMTRDNKDVIHFMMNHSTSEILANSELWGTDLSDLYSAVHKYEN